MPIDVKIDTAEFAAIESRIKDQAKTTLAGSALKAAVGDFAVERLRYQARIGKPFNSANDLPLLKESTIKHRHYLAKYNTTHATFDEGFSNITITGDLMDSLQWDDEGDTLLRLYFAGDHRPYYGAKGQVITEPITNETLARYLSEKGFAPFDMSLDTNRQFISRIKTICQGYIRRGLKIANKLASFDQD